MVASFGIIAERWANGHRYASPSKLVKYLNELESVRNVKGDKLKKHSLEMYEAAEFVVGLGIGKWKS